MITEHKLTGHLVFEVRDPYEIRRGYYDERKAKKGYWDYPYQLEITRRDGTVEYKTANNSCIFEHSGAFAPGYEFDRAMGASAEEVALALRQLLIEINRPVGGTKEERAAQIADYDKAVAAAQAALKKAGVEY